MFADARNTVRKGSSFLTFVRAPDRIESWRADGYDTRYCAGIDRSYTICLAEGDRFEFETALDETIKLKHE